jgi:hypothetical protein
MFLWTGEDCIIESSHRVFHKDHQTKGDGYSYTANKKAGQSDSFISYTAEHYEYFYTVNMGNIMLSEMCANYDNIRIIYEGFPNVEIDSVKYIPPFCREVLVSYVTERVFFAMKSRDVAYRLLWMDAKQDLYVQLGTTKESKWDTAVGLLKKIDTKKRNDIQEYLSYMNY